MSLPTYAEIEETLRWARDGRRLVLKALVDHIVSGGACADPFLALSRFFCRLKSADSIVEKLKRKGIEVRNASDIQERMPDVLGFRIVVANSEELLAIDHWVSRRFELVRREDRNTAQGEFGERGIEYSARDHADGGTYAFELQARTLLQHYWASQSFHLFHKKDRDVALAQQQQLLEFAAALARADECAQRIANGPETALSAPRRPANVPPLTERVHLIVVEPGESFADHVIQSLTGDGARDHEGIVAAKLDLYARFPEAAIVECSCLNFLAFHFNEPLVRVPIELVERAYV